MDELGDTIVVLVHEVRLERHCAQAGGLRSIGLSSVGLSTFMKSGSNDTVRTYTCRHECSPRSDCGLFVVGYTAANARIVH